MSVSSCLPNTNFVCQACWLLIKKNQKESLDIHFITLTLEVIFWVRLSCNITASCYVFILPKLRKVSTMTTSSWFSFTRYSSSSINSLWNTQTSERMSVSSSTMLCWLPLSTIIFFVIDYKYLNPFLSSVWFFNIFCKTRSSSSTGNNTLVLSLYQEYATSNQRLIMYFWWLQLVFNFLVGLIDCL